MQKNVMFMLLRLLYLSNFWYFASKINTEFFLFCFISWRCFFSILKITYLLNKNTPNPSSSSKHSYSYATTYFYLVVLFIPLIHPFWVFAISIATAHFFPCQDYTFMWISIASTDCCSGT